MTQISFSNFLRVWIYIINANFLIYFKIVKGMITLHEDMPWIVIGFSDISDFARVNT